MVADDTGRWLKAALRTRLGWLLACILLVTTGSVRADQDACLHAHEQAQLERMHGRYVEAREQLLRCVQTSCPGVVRNDCNGWLQEVDNSLPSVVFAVADDGGRDLTEARISTEAGPLIDRADGRALTINPGVYKVRIEADGYAPEEQQVSVHEGEKQRLVRVVLHAIGQGSARPAARDAGRAANVPTGSKRAARLMLSGYVLAGVGLASLVTGIAIGAIGKRELDDLHDQECEPACDRDEVNAGRHKYVAANVAFGAAGALLGAAVFTWLWGFKKRHDTRPALSLSADPHGVSFGWGTGF